MEKLEQNWPPVPGIQKIPDSDGPVRIRTDQAVGLDQKIARAIVKAMEKLREEEKGTVRVRDPFQTRIRSFCGWRTKGEFDLVQAGIAGAT